MPLWTTNHSIVRVLAPVHLSQTISEEALGKENVVIDIQMLSKEDLQNVTSFGAKCGYEDWDLSDNVGWSLTTKTINLHGYLGASSMKY